jgi:hypothetical protein
MNDKLIELNMLTTHFKAIRDGSVKCYSQSEYEVLRDVEKALQEYQELLMELENDTP